MISLVASNLFRASNDSRKALTLVIVMSFEREMNF